MTQLLNKPSVEDLEELNKHFTNSSPQQILEWTIQRFSPDITLACSFGGISGMVLLDMAVKIKRDIPIFYLDTAFLFPESYALIEETSHRYNIQPLAFCSKLTPQAQALQYGETLWERDPDLCCSLRKVEPNQAALAGKQAWIAGLRRDQADTRKQVRAVDWDNKFNLFKISPLWNWTEEMVWTYIQVENIPFNPLNEKNYPSLGCTHCTRPVAEGEDARAGRWNGTGKTECGLHR